MGTPTRQLRYEVMSLFNHVQNQDDLLDEMVVKSRYPPTWRVR